MAKKNELPQEAIQSEMMPMDAVCRFPERVGVYDDAYENMAVFLKKHSGSIGEGSDIALDFFTTESIPYSFLVGIAEYINFNEHVNWFIRVPNDREKLLIGSMVDDVTFLGDYQIPYVPREPLRIDD